MDAVSGDPSPWVPGCSAPRDWLICEDSCDALCGLPETFPEVPGEPWPPVGSMFSLAMMRVAGGVGLALSSSFKQREVAAANGWRTYS